MQFKLDMYKMFYKGLVPITTAFTLMAIAAESMSYAMPFDTSLDHFVWPVVFLSGCFMAHPLMVIGMRVQCGHFAKGEIKRFVYRNSLSTF